MVLRDARPYSPSLRASASAALRSFCAGNTDCRITGSDGASSALLTSRGCPATG